MCVLMYMCIYPYINICVYIYIYMNICIHIYVHVHIYIYIYIYMYFIHMYMQHMYMYTHIHIYIYTYIQIDTHIYRSSRVKPQKRDFSVSHCQKCVFPLKSWKNQHLALETCRWWVFEPESRLLFDVCYYGVAMFSRLLKNLGLFCRIWSLLQGFFANETCVLREPTNRSHPIAPSWTNKWI